VNGSGRGRLLVAATLVSVVLGGASAGCGSQERPLTPAEVQRFVLVKETTDNLTRLINLISTADDTTSALSRAKAGSAEARRLRRGARIGWNNVLVGLNAFTPRQARAVSGLAETVGTTRDVAFNWLDVLRAYRGDVGTLARAHKEELKSRRLIRRLAATLARLACSLESKHPELAPAGSAKSDCAAARKLTGTGG